MSGLLASDAVSDRWSPFRCCWAVLSRSKPCAFSLVADRRGITVRLASTGLSLSLRCRPDLEEAGGISGGPESGQSAGTAVSTAPKVFLKKIARSDGVHRARGVRGPFGVSYAHESARLPGVASIALRTARGISTSNIALPDIYGLRSRPPGPRRPRPCRPLALLAYYFQIIEPPEGEKNMADCRYSE